MKHLLFFLCLAVSAFSFSQEKVVWNVQYNAALKQIEFRATIAGGWHLYSQHIQNDIGPVPTTFVFNDLSTVKWEGDVTEPQPIREYDENFEASLDFFKDEVVFIRKITAGSKGVITGYVTYMVCNETMCLPPVDHEFTVTIP